MLLTHPKPRFVIRIARHINAVKWFDPGYRQKYARIQTLAVEYGVEEMSVAYEVTSSSG